MCFWPSECVVGGPLRLNDLKTIFRWFKIILKVVLMFWTDWMWSLRKKTATYICYIVNVFLNEFLAARMRCWWSTLFEWFKNNFLVAQNKSEGGLDVLDWLDVKFEKVNSNIYMIYCECFWMCFWPFECVVGGPLHLNHSKTIVRWFKIILKVV